MIPTLTLLALSVVALFCRRGGEVEFKGFENGTEKFKAWGPRLSTGKLPPWARRRA